MKDYDPDFSAAVRLRRKQARIQLLAYTIAFIIGCAVIGGVGGVVISIIK